MRFAIAIPILLLLASCATSHLGPRKPPSYFVTPSVAYQAEAIGQFPDVVKKSVLPVLRSIPEIERAYLVEIQYPDGTDGTCLCLTPAGAGSMKTAEVLGDAYGPIAAQGTYLDIMFIDDDSLRRVESVARPFYVRP